MSEREMPKKKGEFVWDLENDARRAVEVAYNDWIYARRHGDIFELPDGVYAFRFSDGEVYFVALMRDRYIKDTGIIEDWNGPLSDNALLDRTPIEIKPSDKYL